MVSQRIVFRTPAGGLRAVPVWQGLHMARIRVHSWRVDGAQRGGHDALTMEVVAPSAADVQDAVAGLRHRFPAMEATIGSTIDAAGAGHWVPRSEESDGSA
jgi:hypothetical protein